MSAKQMMIGLRKKSLFKKWWLKDIYFWYLIEEKTIFIVNSH